VHGDAGKDRVLGGDGDDNVWGDGEDDILKGGDGSDNHYAGAGEDICFIDNEDKGKELKSCEVKRNAKRNNQSLGPGRFKRIEPSRAVGAQ
jgi:Ca2+-binding RTX toxin-like protein